MKLTVFLIFFAGWVLAQAPGPAPGADKTPAADKVPGALTLEQQVKFQTALKDFYVETTIANDLSGQFQRELSDKAKALQVEIARQGKTQNAAEDAVKAACPGEVVGLLAGKPECKPKAPAAAAPPAEPVK